MQNVKFKDKAVKGGIFIENEPQTAEIQKRLNETQSTHFITRLRDLYDKFDSL